MEIGVGYESVHDCHRVPVGLLVLLWRLGHLNATRRAMKGEYHAQAIGSARQTFSQPRLISSMEVWQPVHQANDESPAGPPVLSAVQDRSLGATTDGGTVPEEIVTDWRAASDTGYGLSKLGSERILDDTAKTAGMTTAICRVGQIVGPSKSSADMWPKQGWLHILVASSEYLGKLPSSLGSLDQVICTTVDVLGRSVEELAVGAFGDGGDCELSGPAYHAINSMVGAWADLTPVVHDALRVEIVSLDTWDRSIQTVRVSNSGLDC